MSLTGKTVVVTRGVNGSQEWIKRLSNLGAEVYNLPTIVMSPVKPSKDLVKTLRSLDQFDWAVFTSASGIRYLTLLSLQLGLQIHNNFPPVAVIGPKTAAAAKSVGLRIAFKPTTSDSQALAKELPVTQGQRILLLRTTIASDDLPTSLENRGAIVIDAKIYKTDVLTSNDPIFSKILNSQKVDFITFASPSAVAGFSARLSNADLKKAKVLPVVAIGPSVAKALQVMDFLDIHTASKPTLDSVIATLQKLPE